MNIFQDLTKQLLGETKTKLDRWRDKIKKALGDNAQVIVEAIPDLELIIGKQKNQLQNCQSMTLKTGSILYSKNS